MDVKFCFKTPITDPVVIEVAKRMVDKYPTPDNQYEFALMILNFSDESEYRLMFDALKKASESDHPDATHLLGTCYSRGWGVEKDEKKGVELYIKSAEMGSISGCFSAGNELLLGKRIDPDYSRAYTYLKKAADDGDERAFNSLGIMYLYGYNVEQNLRTARRLFKKSARKGNEQAKLNLEMMKILGKNLDLSDMKILMPSERQKGGGVQ